MKQVGAALVQSDTQYRRRFEGVPEGLTLRLGKGTAESYCVTRKIPHSPPLNVKLSCVL